MVNVFIRLSCRHCASTTCHHGLGISIVSMFKHASQIIINHGEKKLGFLFLGRNKNKRISFFFLCTKLSHSPPEWRPHSDRTTIGITTRSSCLASIAEETTTTDARLCRRRRPLTASTSRSGWNTWSNRKVPIPSCRTRQG